MSWDNSSRVKESDMAINTTDGNLLSNIKEGLIIHGCNALGVMGAGFAKQVKQMYPEAFRVYKEHERVQGLKLGSVSFAQVDTRLWIANAITQSRIYGAPGEMLADLDAIEISFRESGDFARNLGLDVEMPLVGCGLAGGVWGVVEPRVLKGLGAGVKSRLWLYTPSRAPTRSAGVRAR